MTAEEKHFYHFKMHDYDNNNLLDGLEILQSANVHDDTFHGHKKPSTVHRLSPSAADSDNDSDDNDDSRRGSEAPIGTGGEELGLQHLVGKQQHLQLHTLFFFSVCS